MPHNAEHDIASTMWFDQIREWKSSVDIVDPRGERYWRHQARVLREARTHRAMIVMGAVALRHGYRDVVSAVLIKIFIRRPKRPIVVIADATWGTFSASLARVVGRRVSSMLASAIVRAIDGAHVNYCVLSSDELEKFAATWGVDPDRVWFTPFPVLLSNNDVDLADEGVSSASDVFAGGDSLRDYELLVSALDDVDATAVIATHTEVEAESDQVTCGPLSHEDYMRQFGSATVVALPLEYDSPRSAGQQTYLAAAALGKPLVVNDAPGVSDYLEDGEHAVVVPNGDADAFAGGIKWCLDNPQDAGDMATRAQRHVGQYNLAAYCRSLFDVAHNSILRRSE